MAIPWSDQGPGITMTTLLSFYSQHICKILRFSDGMPDLCRVAIWPVDGLEYNHQHDVNLILTAQIW